jgi:hypothetical protein
MRPTDRQSLGRGLTSFVIALALLACAFVASSPAQEAARRPARSLTSEDLLNRPAIYVPQPASDRPTPSPVAATAMGATQYRDPAGAFTLSFPNGNWRVNSKAGSAGRLYHQRAFRRIEAEGYASATTSVYVLTESARLPIVDPSRLSADGQRELASALAALFLSNNATLVSVEAAPSNTRAGLLRIIADQSIARRVIVRASINVFERQGRLFVVVCRAPAESFDVYAREFETITNSLASSAVHG